ncbi:MAG: L-seryl-tRNA(Sec) selenium transferase [Clostridia bacterium]
MNTKQAEMRQLPKMDGLLGDARLAELIETRGKTPVRACAREVLEDARCALLEGEAPEVTEDALVARIVARMAREGHGIRPVINATGILLHTNLGRAVLGERQVKAALRVAGGYSDLEYDRATGQRGCRYAQVSRLMRELVGAEDALVVNNNASAVLLALGVVAKGRETVVSRGELVEIGGSFRVPEIMGLSGTVLKEVGTTNRTRLSDYEMAIGEATGALMKVHTSNFKMVGFTEETSISSLCELGRRRELPVLYDIGSGALFPLDQMGVPGEPCVRDAIKAGVDIVTFSGDKLLGGPQAGLIVGKRKLIAQMKAHPLMRALRPGKVTLALLYETLSCYEDEAIARRDIPVLHMLAQPMSEMWARGTALVKLLQESGIACALTQEHGQVGGGSAPAQALDSVACRIEDRRLSADALEKALRQGETPVIARIAKDCVLLDMRTVLGEQIPSLSDALRAVLRPEGR